MRIMKQKYQKIYIVTVQRENPRDYQVCRCRSISEAQEKLDVILADCGPGRKLMWYTIEELMNGERKVISGAARA